MSEQAPSPEDIKERWLKRKFSRKSTNWAGTCQRAVEEWFEYCDEYMVDMTGETEPNSEINKYHLEEFDDWLKQDNDYSGNTRDNKIMAVRNFLQYAAGRYGWSILLNKGQPNSVFEAEVSESEETRYKKETGTDIPYVTDDEHEAMLEVNENPRDDLILRLLNDTGCRPHELRNAIIDNFEPDKRRIYVDTAKRDDHQRWVYVSPTTRRRLMEWIYDGGRDAYSSEAYGTDYILVTKRNGKLKGDVINKQVKRLAREAGIQRTAYSRETEHILPRRDGSRDHYELEREFKAINAKAYRHRFCVRAVRNGISLGMLSELTGHADTSSLEDYLKFREEDRKDSYDDFL